MQAAISALVQRTPAVKRGHLGFKVIDLGSGEIIAQKEADTFFTPASNTKLYTTAFALSRLGAKYIFTTQLQTSHRWTPEQTMIYDLELIGGGDPNLSGRVLPYSPSSREGDPLNVVKELAANLFAGGIREINGDVTGIATRYPGNPYPDGWTIDDSIYGYGAPVSSLTVNDGIISLTVRPTPTGRTPKHRSPSINQSLYSAEWSHHGRLARDEDSDFAYAGKQ